MDLLTHLFLPITIAFVLRSAAFENPLAFGLAGFAILPDADKVLGMVGAFHSLLVVVPVAGAVVVLERRLRGEWRYAPIAVALLLSHLLLDVVDGNRVALLAPLVETGIGLRYPGELVLGGAWPIRVEGAPLEVVLERPRVGSGGSGGSGGGDGVGRYAFLEKYGVLSALVFLVVVGRRFDPRSG